MPLQRGQAPAMVLKEKLSGDGSLYEMPVVGHISRRE